MGCDMHCVVEAHNKKSGEWECFGVSTAHRNYSLFSRIADVRNSEDEASYIEPIDDPRGWPVDASGPADAWYNRIDIPFSATWLERKELESLNIWVREREMGDLWKMLEFDHLSCFFSFDKGWEKAAFARYSNLRVIFFFDC